jgi:two-component system chemotaxis response regulator CheB
MAKLRVLIVDDSTVIRRLLSDALASDPAIEVVGSAANGRIALAKIPQVNPDVITLDIEMPDMDGLETIQAIRKSYPRLPVIMFSTLTQRGAIATLNALSFGANDYVTKPANVGSVTAAIQNVRHDLIPKIKALCRLPSENTRPAPTAAVAERPPLLPRRPLTPPEVIAIGVSTGGPNALTQVFRDLPGDLPTPVVVVQHMPPVFTRHLAERLDAVSPLTVREATPGALLRPGEALLAAGDFHLALARVATGVVARLHQGPPENSCRPAVDVLFRSVAELYGPAALALVMTGMGQDGKRGASDIRDAGGRVLAQDEASSVVWGMPGAVVQAGLADETLPLSRIASRLSALASANRNSPPQLAIPGATR